MSRVNIEEDGASGEFWITAPYDEDFIESIKDDLNGWWDREEKVWIVSCDDYSYDDVAKLLRLHFPRDFK